ncbi:restriction endonuclease [Streptomyces endophyticus]|uniref:Restriction endonuclease n=1 Tax=Streptomyces endophyticus TaxID=714166 RepID=A0ABU6FFF8_9ACTN|nr:restriction endonuclease [Streptomyces endophyticus]
MINETALIESKALRDSVLERTDTLDKVKALSLLPDGMHVTTAVIAAYFGVTTEVIRQLKRRHHQELTTNGMITLQGSELEEFKRDTLSRYPTSYPQPRSSLTLYSRRAVLNVAMLLRDSDVARQVRAYLLDMEYLARTQPADAQDTAGNDALDARIDQRIDQRIADTLGKTVVPMFNALIATSGEHRRELIDLRAGIQHVEHRIRRHQARLQRLEAGLASSTPTVTMAAMDAMNGSEFEDHVAALLRRDGCTDVVVRGGRGDHGVDITAVTPDGRRVPVQCKRFAPYLSVTSADMQKFIGGSKVLRISDVSLFVATCRFTTEAVDIAAETGVTVVPRGLLEEWSTGAPLTILK